MSFTSVRVGHIILVLESSCRFIPYLMETQQTLLNWMILG